jgi:hypothetical protein
MHFLSTKTNPKCGVHKGSESVASLVTLNAAVA